MTRAFDTNATSSKWSDPMQSFQLESDNVVASSESKEKRMVPKTFSQRRTRRSSLDVARAIQMERRKSSKRTRRFTICTQTILFNPRDGVPEENVKAKDDTHATRQTLNRSETREHPKASNLIKDKNEQSHEASVHFATDSYGHVSRKIRTFPKATRAQHEVLWWNDEDMKSRYKKDEEIVLNTQKRYGMALEKAYKSVEKGGPGGNDPDLKFETFRRHADARGLESEVYPTMTEHIKRHRKAVLASQRLNRLGDPISSMEDVNKEIIRLNSLKFSRPSGLLATTLGMYDHRMDTQSTNFSLGNLQNQDEDAMT